MPNSIGEVVSRRSVLKFSGAAAALVSVAQYAPILVPTSPAKAAADLAEPDQLLRTLVRMRGSLDEQLAYVWLKGKRFAISNNQIKPMCGYSGLGITRYRPLDDGSYEFKLYELSYYTELETGQQLERLAMPFTENTVEVPLYRTGPGTHILLIENSETLRWDSTKTGGSDDSAAQLAPDASIYYDIQIQPAITAGNNVFIRSDSMTRMVPDDPDEKGLLYKEAITYRGNMRDIDESDTASVPSTMTFAIATSWRPWMQMGALPGHTTTDGFGGKSLSVDGLPSDILQLTEQHHPDVLENPEKLLDGA